MGSKAKKQIVEKKDAKTELQLLIQSKINSPYSLLIPVKDDSVIFVQDPVKKLNMKVKVNAQEFTDLLTELCDYGLLEKLDKDFNTVAQYSEFYILKWNEFKTTYNNKGAI